MTVHSGMKRVKRRLNPFEYGAIDALTTTLTVGAEGSGATANVINVAVQLKDSNGRLPTVPMRVRLALYSDTSGTQLVTPPTDGVYKGSAGQLIQGSDHLRDGIIAKGSLAIDATPEKFKTTATLTARLNGVTFTKAAATAILFSAAHVVTASKFGIILIQSTSGGTVSTKVPGATQTTAMAYDSAALALAALPPADVGKVAIGYIAIAAKAATWTANTDDLTNGSDLTTATFVDATEQIGPVTFEAISNATGAFNFNIKDSGTPTMYAGILMPDGKIKYSAAITFA